MNFKINPDAPYIIRVLDGAYWVSNKHLVSAPVLSDGEIDFQGSVIVSEAAFSSEEERAHFINTIQHMTGWIHGQDYLFEGVPAKKGFVPDEFYCHLSNFLSAGEALTEYWNEYGQGKEPEKLIPFMGYPFSLSFDDVVSEIRAWKCRVYDTIVNRKKKDNGNNL